MDRLPSKYNDATKNSMKEFECILSSMYQPGEQERLNSARNELTDAEIYEFLMDFDQQYCY